MSVVIFTPAFIQHYQEAQPGMWFFMIKSQVMWVFSIGSRSIWSVTDSSVGTVSCPFLTSTWPPYWQPPAVTWLDSLSPTLFSFCTLDAWFVWVTGKAVLMILKSMSCLQAEPPLPTESSDLVGRSGAISFLAHSVFLWVCCHAKLVSRMEWVIFWGSPKKFKRKRLSLFFNV